MSKRRHRVTLYIDDDMKDRLSIAAAKNNRSVRDEVHAVLSGAADPLPSPQSQPIYLVCKEGGEFVPFTIGRKPFDSVHAVYFADGSQFDVVNGWRKNYSTRRNIVRVQMGRAVQ